MKDWVLNLFIVGWLLVCVIFGLSLLWLALKAGEQARAVVPSGSVNGSA